MKVFLSIIIAVEYSAAICEYIYKQIENESFFQNVSHNEEVYWKNHTMSKICFEFDACKAISEADWIQLFDKHIKHHTVFRDDYFFEIDHYSANGDRNDPFVVLNIPMDLVKA